ncbi:MAG TPA: hypothetical protein PKD53_10725 [Chloroflexaceae bacterium]|nr:hypothetical protein [Chloroflexaceae bacterium]
MEPSAETAEEQYRAIESNPPVCRPHSISRRKFVEVLVAMRSPAAAEAETLADIPGRYGIDRGIALAFFVHESSAGRAGIVRDYQTRNWGNLRRPQRPARGVLVATRGGPFARYVSWAAGLEDWCELMVDVYGARWRLHTLGDVLKKYAPREDQNDPEHYARKVVQHIRRWQGEMQKAGARRARPPWHVTVTATAGLNVRQGRGTAFPIAAKLAHGERVLVGDDRDGWLWLCDGRGFIAKAYTAES